MGLLGDIADFGKGVIANNLKWTERAAKVGEFIARNTVGPELEQVGKFGGQIVDLSQKATNFFASQIGQRLIRTARSPILAAGQQTIESMKHSTGVGVPENGERFGQGADKMGAVGQVLASAFPDDSWNSGGAGVYASRNTEQVGRVQTMLGLDNMVAGVLTAEAGQIATARDSLDEHSDWLGAMSLLTTSAGIIPGFGTAAQMSAEFAMVAKAVGDSSGDLKTLHGHIDQNAAVLRTAAWQYESLAGGAATNGAEFAPPVGDQEEPLTPGEPGIAAPGESTGDSSGGGGNALSGGGAPAGGGGGGAPTGSTSPLSAPAMPSSMPAAAASPSPAMASEAAGALGGILGSLVSPLGGILGGVLQAASQAAAQAAQAGTQAAQLGSQAGGAGAAQLDQASGGADADDRDEDDREDGDSREKDDAKDGEKDGEGEGDEPAKDQAGGPSTADSAGESADPLGGGVEDGPAKTLPPDLEAVAAGGGVAGPAPVHVGADFEQGQLHMAAAATLDRGVPGSAAVIDR